MTKQTNEPTSLSNGHAIEAPPSNAADPQPRTSEMQLRAFKDLALRISTDLSAERFEATLRALLVPLKKKPDDSATARPPTSNPEP